MQPVVYLQADNGTRCNVKRHRFAEPGAKHEGSSAFMVAHILKAPVVQGKQTNPLYSFVRHGLVSQSSHEQEGAY